MDPIVAAILGCLLGIFIGTQIGIYATSQVLTREGLDLRSLLRGVLDELRPGVRL